MLHQAILQNGVYNLCCITGFAVLAEPIYCKLTMPKLFCVYIDFYPKFLVANNLGKTGRKPLASLGRCSVILFTKP